MNIQTQQFVTKSDLFSGLDGLENLFNEADHNDITWGDASRTMTTPEYFLDWLDDEETIEEIGE